MEPTYSPSIEELITARPRMPLDGGSPSPSVIERLDAAMLERLFGAHIVRDRTAARLCLAGLWLLYDHLDECHAIAQAVETPDGSYWHAIMHRREGDFQNSAYWFRRVGEHAIFPPLHAAVNARLTGFREFGLPDGRWDPFRFIDLCEKAGHTGSSLKPTCEEVQMIEWRLLFGHCFRKATVSEY